MKTVLLLLVTPLLFLFSCGNNEEIRVEKRDKTTYEERAKLQVEAYQKELDACFDSVSAPMRDTIEHLKKEIERIRPLVQKKLAIESEMGVIEDSLKVLELERTQTFGESTIKIQKTDALVQRWQNLKKEWDPIYASIHKE